jgi:mRNA interferase MazF
MIKTGSNLFFPVRGEIWIADFDPIRGHEQGGVRPTLVVSGDAYNRSPAELVMVAPITRTGRGVPAHVRVIPPEGGLAKASFIMTDQLRTISKARLSRRLGLVASGTMIEVERHLRMHLEL